MIQFGSAFSSSGGFHNNFQGDLDNQNSLIDFLVQSLHYKQRSLNVIKRFNMKDVHLNFLFATLPQPLDIRASICFQKFPRKNFPVDSKV